MHAPKMPSKKKIAENLNKFGKNKKNSFKIVGAVALFMFIESHKDMILKEKRGVGG